MASENDMKNASNQCDSHFSPSTIAIVEHTEQERAEEAEEFHQTDCITTSWNVFHIQNAIEH